MQERMPWGLGISGASAGILKHPKNILKHGNTDLHNRVFFDILVPKRYYLLGLRRLPSVQACKNVTST